MLTTFAKKDFGPRGVVSWVFWALLSIFVSKKAHKQIEDVTMEKGGRDKTTQEKDDTLLGFSPSRVPLGVILNYFSLIILVIAKHF